MCRIERQVGQVVSRICLDVWSVCFLKGGSELSFGIGRSLSGNARRLVVVVLLPL